MKVSTMTTKPRARTCFSTEGGKITTWHEDEILCGACPMCCAHALTPVKIPQPDETTHVCNPGFGGCNQGFAMNGGDA